MSDQTMVSRARLDRLLTALACASVDQLDGPECQIEPQAEDDFGMLEGAFALFLAELVEAKTATQVVLAKQQETIRALSTPVIDVWEGVLTLPLIGAVDSKRAVEMTEQLLSRVVQSRARAVILDLTGVDVVDADTADHLVRLVRAAELLGARCIVSGVSPEIARAVVGMGIDLGAIRTLRTLEEALRTCIAEGS